jgi:hypothetical protein
MIKMRILCCIWLLFFSPAVTPALSQNNYPPDGIYTSFSAFRTGTPEVVRNQLVRGSSSSSDYVFRQWFSGEKLYYMTGDGERQELDRRSVWGYVENGTLSLFIGNKFHRVSVLGSISYFLESYPMIRGNVAPVVTDARSTAVYRYTPENMLILLAPDQNLFEEFKSLKSTRLQKRRMYSFMERFNRAHPLRSTAGL